MSRAPATAPAVASGRPQDAPASSAETARVLRGGPLAARIREGVAADVASLTDEQGFPPTLAVLTVGRDDAAGVYIEQLERNASRVGAAVRVDELPADATVADVRRRLQRLGQDRGVNGIVVRQPLPPSILLPAVADFVEGTKDIDAINPRSAGLLELGCEGFHPATAQAALEILAEGGIALEGLHAVVIGRSNLVGKPTALLLLRQHCTVTICHRRTRDLRARTREADLLVVAAGSPRLVDGGMIKHGAVVVDIGINVLPEVVGDVDFESAAPVASAITPVPGGVGPVTHVVLLRNLVRATRAQLEGET